jgi:hypothetical protein
MIVSRIDPPGPDRYHWHVRDKVSIIREIGITTAIRLWGNSLFFFTVPQSVVEALMPTAGALGISLFTSN